MILLDSNPFIYAAQPEHGFLRALMWEKSFAASQTSRIEVLGFHRITLDHKRLFEEMFNSVKMLSITGAIIDSSILLRQQRRLSLGDAIVAATAMEWGMVLWTHNIKDFSWINTLAVHDPFEEIPPNI